MKSLEPVEMIRNVKLSDANDICNIYNEYVENSTATFEEEPVSPDEMVSLIKKVTSGYPWIIYEENKKVIGYTYADRWKARSAYRYSVETGICINSDYVEKKTGSKLQEKLIELLKEKKSQCCLWNLPAKPCKHCAL